MLRRITHTLFALWLATLVLYGIMPKDVVHAFTSHTDTVHQHDIPGPVAEEAHHHCGFLSFELLPFDAPFGLPLVLKERDPGALAYPLPAGERAAHRPVARCEVRGPPAA